MPDLMMESQERGDVMVIYPRGFINAHTVRQFEQELERSVESGRTQIVINGSGLSYIASAGLGAIMGHIEVVRSKGAISDSRISMRPSSTSLKSWDSITSVGSSIPKRMPSRAILVRARLTVKNSKNH